MPSFLNNATAVFMYFLSVNRCTHTELRVALPTQVLQVMAETGSDHMGGQRAKVEDYWLQMFKIFKQSVPLPAVMQYNLLRTDENSLIPSPDMLANLSPQPSPSPGQFLTT